MTGDTMALLAIGLYLLGLLLAFGVRSVRQRRRTGDTGLRFDAGPIGSLRWWARLLFLAALGLGLAGPGAALLGMAVIGPLDHSAVRIVGLFLTVIGVAATLFAQADMGNSWRVGVDPAERTTLVTTGGFAMVRNPVFTAMGLTSVGLLLMVGNPVSVAATAVLIVSIQLQVRVVEEPYLRSVHGQAYSEYAARVGRFVPGVGVADPTSEGA